MRGLCCVKRVYALNHPKDRAALGHLANYRAEFDLYSHKGEKHGRLTITLAGKLECNVDQTKACDPCDLVLWSSQLTSAIESEIAFIKRAFGEHEKVGALISALDMVSKFGESAKV